ncbi:hypothetical protein [Sulfitobacter aestuariivivens]|uniref:hypothetical protein n=1 Tax=Sulfitobacter aestuariivivens TaxID=2766981 RepID=UPI003614B088
MCGFRAFTQTPAGMVNEKQSAVTLLNRALQEDPKMDCVRSITFVIPGTDGLPGVQVTAVEIDGAIEFTLEVLPTLDGATADLRGLFFNLGDEASLLGLTPTGDDVTNHATGNVIDLGRGNNMQGSAQPYDFGVAFGGPGIGKDKGDIQTTTFTLTNDAGDLTLDDIAQVEFGTRITSVGELGANATALAS